MKTDSQSTKTKRPTAKSNLSNVFRIRIKLRNYSPPIWRRIEVPYEFTLHQLHLTIQAAMGWDNYHLYAFRIGRVSYSVPDSEWPKDDGDSRKTKINELIFFGRKAKMVYEYDFGDGWEHDVTIEKILPPEAGVKYPRCISGKLACPPEDCGGTYGYARMLEIIRNPQDEEYAETIEWLGSNFDPNEFDLEDANERVYNYEDYETGL
ncbi:MAG: plasmid pRiA4b ORF-3 family protein [Thermoplasmataceae archaeon]